MNESRFKFRAWHNGIKCHPKTKNIPAQMLYDEKPGDCLVWARDQDIAQVMQFTGLFDRVGNEIYEGDILAFHQLSCFSSKHGEIYEDAVAVVIWTINGAGFSIDIKKGHLHSFDMEKGEIIGNIYENNDMVNHPKSEYESPNSSKFVG